MLFRSVVQLAVHDALDLVERQVDAVVGDAALREVVGADALGTVARADQGFAQGRVTDHRINLTLYKIERIMDGELDDVVNALAAEHQAEQLAQLSEKAA